MNQTPEQAADAFVKKLRKEMSNRSLLNRPIVHQELEGIAHEAFMEGVKVGCNNNGGFPVEIVNGGVAPIGVTWKDEDDNGVERKLSRAQAEYLAKRGGLFNGSDLGNVTIDDMMQRLYAGGMYYAEFSDDTKGSIDEQIRTGKKPTHIELLCYLRQCIILTGLHTTRIACVYDALCEYLKFKKY